MTPRIEAIVHWKRDTPDGADAGPEAFDAFVADMVAENRAVIRTVRPHAAPPARFFASVEVYAPRHAPEMPRPAAGRGQGRAQGASGHQEPRKPQRPSGGRLRAVFATGRLARRLEAFR